MLAPNVCVLLLETFWLSINIQKQTQISQVIYDDLVKRHHLLQDSLCKEQEEKTGLEKALCDFRMKHLENGVEFPYSTSPFLFQWILKYSSYVYGLASYK